MKNNIIIGKSRYSIQKVKTIEKDPNVLGKILHNTQRIYIKKDNRKVESETLYHEIAHGIMVDLALKGADNGVKMRELNSIFKLNNDEGFIEYFGCVLRKMFKLR